MKKICIIPVSLIIFFTILFFLPQIIIQTPTNYMSEYDILIEYKDNKDEFGEYTIKQMDEYMHRSSIIKEKHKKILFFYPIFIHAEIDTFEIGATCYLFDCNDKEALKQKIKKISVFEKDDFIIESDNAVIINSSDLYFFRVYADFTDNATFENVYIKKYPWSKKLKYEPKDE